MSEIMAKESSEELEFGELAQLVERCDRTAEVRGSSPLFSISHNTLRRSESGGRARVGKEVGSDVDKEVDNASAQG